MLASVLSSASLTSPVAVVVEIDVRATHGKRRPCGSSQIPLMAVARKRQFPQADQSDLGGPVLRAKIFRSRRRANQNYDSRHPVPPEGRRPSSRTLGQVAVDADAMTDEGGVKRTAKSCGPDAAVLASSCADRFLRDDGGKRAVHRGEHEVSRKATAQGRPGCSR